MSFVIRLTNAALGIWLMASPAVLGYGNPAETNDRIVGPLIATLAIIAIWDILRPARRVNLVLGLWLIAAPWVLPLFFDPGYPPQATLNSMVVGAFVAALSLYRGKLGTRFGGGWRVLWQGDPHLRGQGPERR